MILGSEGRVDVLFGHLYFVVGLVDVDGHIIIWDIFLVFAEFLLELDLLD